MSATNGQWQGSRSGSGEDPIEIGRYLEALRRNRMLIAMIVTIVTAVTLVVSLTLPKTYKSTATILVNNTAGVLGSESQAIQRNLQTTATLVTTAAVLGEAAQYFHGQTRASLAEKVSASVEENANIINIKVTYKTAEGAARLASAVAHAFERQHAALEHSQLASALAALNAQISTLRARATSEPSAVTQLGALQARASELEATSAGTDAQLQLAQQPPVPGAAASPRPARNLVIALFASIFLAVLVALGREQLTPRVTSQRELGQLLGLPVLSGVPIVSRRVNARYARAEYEAYQSLSAAVRLALPPTSTPHVMLVTGATHGEGKTTVTTRLGRMLAQAGHNTLIVSADLRWPKLDAAFKVGGKPGVRELLATASATGAPPVDEARRLILATGDDDSRVARGELDILPSGRHGEDASELLHTTALQSLIEALRDNDYAYILIDAPPLLGLADSQMLAQFCDEVLLVSRLDLLKISDVVDLREMFDRLNANPIGVVVIGTRPSGSPYYWDTRSTAEAAGTITN
jgi:Mrp family chromosome partitioning ATPase/LPS O-antigen subunit length determinant protein (WzzB/FepE family)